MLLDVAIALLGLAVVAAVLNDAVGTTLRLQGGGKLTNAISRATWNVLHFFHRRREKHLLSSYGVVALLATITTWLALLWLGWLLVFLPFESAVLSSSLGAPADFWSRVYFVGFSAITLGVGDYVPNGGFFQVATVVAASSGFILVTLSVTYLLPVLSAVVETRQMAAQIFLLGATPTDIVVNTRDGGKNSELVNLAGTLVAPIALLSQRQFAYPVLRYFHSKQRETSLGVGLAVLDESLTLLLHGIRAGHGVSATELMPIRNAIRTYLEIEIEELADQAETAKPGPSLEPLREAGIPTVDDEEFRERVAALHDRRTLLFSLVEQEDRSWSEVHTHTDGIRA